MSWGKKMNETIKESKNRPSVYLWSEHRDCAEIISIHDNIDDAIWGYRFWEEYSSTILTIVDNN